MSESLAICYEYSCDPKLTVVSFRLDCFSAGFPSVSWESAPGPCLAAQQSWGLLLTVSLLTLWVTGATVDLCGHDWACKWVRGLHLDLWHPVQISTTVPRPRQWPRSVLADRLCMCVCYCRDRWDHWRARLGRHTTKLLFWIAGALIASLKTDANQA